MLDIARILTWLGFPHFNTSNTDTRRQRPEPKGKQRTQRRLKTKWKAWSRKWVSKITYGKSYQAVNNTSPCWDWVNAPLSAKRPRQQAIFALRPDSKSWLAFLTTSFGMSSAARPQFADARRKVWAGRQCVRCSSWPCHLWAAPRPAHASFFPSDLSHLVQEVRNSDLQNNGSQIK